jgi:hypothetical protein
MLAALPSLSESTALVPVKSIPIKYGNDSVLVADVAPKSKSKSSLKSKSKRKLRLSAKEIDLPVGCVVKLRQEGLWYRGVVRRWGQRAVVLDFDGTKEKWRRKDLIRLQKYGGLKIGPPKKVKTRPEVQKRVDELRDLINVEEADTFTPSQRTSKEISRVKKKLKKYRSAFKKGVPEIHRLVHEGNSARAATIIQKHLLLSLTEMIPLVEDAVIRAENGRGVYSLNSLISQARELIADIQSERDHGAIAQRISTEVLQNTMILITQNLAHTLSHIRGGLNPYLKDDHNQERVNELFNNNIRDMGRYISQQYQETSEKIVNLLIREG